MAQRPAQRKSFFGGLVSTREKCERECGALPLPTPTPSTAAPRKKAKPGGVPGTKPGAPGPPLSDRRRTEKALQKREAEIKAHKVELAAMMKAMLAAPDSMDPVPVVKRPAGRRLNAEPSKELVQKIQNNGAHSNGKPPGSEARLRQQGTPSISAASSTTSVSVQYDSSGRRVVTHTLHSPHHQQQQQQQRTNGVKSLRALGKKVAPGKGADRPGKLRAGPSPGPGRGAPTLEAEAIPKGHKQCRACLAVKPVPLFLEDLRLIGNVSRYCAACSTKKGLTGRPATLQDDPSTGQGKSARAGRPLVPQVGGATAAQQRQLAAAAHAGGAFYAGAGARPGVARAAEARMLGGGAKQRQRPNADEYDYDDGFLEDEDGEADALAELREVTRKFYRQDRGDDGFNDRMMETSAAEMRREEARSRKMGRQEDAEAERQLLAEQAAKDAKRKAHKRRHSSAFLDDGSEGSADD